MDAINALVICRREVPKNTLFIWRGKEHRIRGMRWDLLRILGVLRFQSSQHAARSMDPNLSTYGLHARNDLGSILQKRKGKGKNKEEAAGETAEMPFNRLYTTVRPGKLTSRRRGDTQPGGCRSGASGGSGRGAPRFRWGRTHSEVDSTETVRLKMLEARRVTGESRSGA